MIINVRHRKPFLGNIAGGLSGPAIRPIAVKMVYDTYKKVKIPIIGGGGIMNWHDACEFLMAGASAVCVGTVNFVDPAASLEIVEGLTKYMNDNGFNSIKKITGIAQV